MRNSLFLLIIALFSSFQIAVITTTDLNVMKAAEGQMGIFLSKIPPGESSSYGFRQEDDLELATVGKPYRIIELNQDFYRDSAPQEDKNYFTIKNEWLAPVSVREANRAMLTVKGNPGNYAVTAMGDTSLARELQAKSHGISDSDEYYLLRIPALNAEFFIHEATSSFLDAEFIPLASAMAAIPALGKSYTAPFTIMEIEKKIKDELTRPAAKQPIKKQAIKKRPIKKQPPKKPAPKKHVPAYSN